MIADDGATQITTDSQSIAISGFIVSLFHGGERDTMSLCSIRSLRAMSIGLCGLCLQGCVADFVAPLSVVSRRYPPTAQAQANDPSIAQRQVAATYTVAKSERLPTPREIFDFHPKGMAADRSRQPFLLNPNEGPLKIPHLAAADAVAEQGQPRPLVPARPVLDLTPRATVLAPASSFGHR